MANRPTERLAWMIARFCEERILWDYLEDGKLLGRVNQVMRRVTLSPLPDDFQELFPEARRKVAGRRAGALGGDSDRRGEVGWVECSEPHQENLPETWWGSLRARPTLYRALYSPLIARRRTTMRYGMNLLLWTDTMNEAILPVLDELKKIGYDAVEIPIFDLDVEKYAKFGKRLDEAGLARTGVTIRGRTTIP